MKNYIVYVKLLDRKHSIDFPVYRTHFEYCNTYRELRDYLVKFNFQDNEYTVFEESNIKIKKIGGYAE